MRTKRKLIIEFDPKKRLEFLTGFQKRKNERRKRAKEEFEMVLKEEKKRIQRKVKEEIQRLKDPDNTAIFNDLEIPVNEEYDDEKNFVDENVTVKVTELVMNNIAQKQNWIAPNAPKYDADDNDSTMEKEEPDFSVNDGTDEAPGMELTGKPAKKSKYSVSTSQRETIERKEKIGSKKELDYLKKKRISKSMRKSKIFKMKYHYEKRQNKKIARKQIKLKKKIKRKEKQKF